MNVPIIAAARPPTREDVLGVNEPGDIRLPEVLLCCKLRQLCKKNAQREYNGMKQSVHSLNQSGRRGTANTCIRTAAPALHCRKCRFVRSPLSSGKYEPGYEDSSPPHFRFRCLCFCRGEDRGLMLPTHVVRATIDPRESQKGPMMVLSVIKIHRNDCLVLQRAAQGPCETEDKSQGQDAENDST